MDWPWCTLRERNVDSRRWRLTQIFVDRVGDDADDFALGGRPHHRDTLAKRISSQVRTREGLVDNRNRGRAVIVLIRELAAQHNACLERSKVGGTNHIEVKLSAA